MNTTKSGQIRTGLRKSFQTGESTEASIVHYGYKTTSEGRLVACPIEAIIVFHIFERFVDGDSLGKIAVSLVHMKVKSPTGRELWMREAINKILNNEKYAGGVILGGTQVQDDMQVKMIDRTSQTVINGHHETTISRELFDIVQQEKAHRNGLKSHFYIA